MMALNLCGGAAAVFGAARAVGAMAPPGVEAHFIVAACENMINEKAMVRPIFDPQQDIEVMVGCWLRDSCCVMQEYGCPPHIIVMIGFCSHFSNVPFTHFTLQYRAEGRLIGRYVGVRRQRMRIRRIAVHWPVPSWYRWAKILER
jgi:hypothetical protein